MNTSIASAAPNVHQPAPAKLAALLGLATSAIALPQTGQADIIYTDLNSSPVEVSFLAANEFIFNNLPGTVQFGFRRGEFTQKTQPFSVSTIYYRSVLAGDLGTVGMAPAIIRGAGGVVARLPLGASWDQGGAGPYYNIPAGIVNDLAARNPVSDYSHQFFAWSFADSTQGNALRYGWIEASLSIGGYVTGPRLTVHGYAYDNTGAKPTMGQLPVPEPSSGALLALGAMALGARGVRQWRQNRQPVKSA